MTAIATPTDFLGVNNYTRAIVTAPTQGFMPQEVRPDHAADYTEMGWEVYPDGLFDLLNRLHFEYQVPKLYITENGASYGEEPDAQGVIHDRRRIAYLRDYLAVCQRAIIQGVPLAGYFQWSLMDNFEWAKGYTQRFGMVWVDFATQQRIPKASAHWYASVIAANVVTV